MIMAGLNPEIVDLIAPPATANLEQPFAFKLSDSVIDDGEQNYWPNMNHISPELLERRTAADDYQMFMSGM